MGQIDPEFVVDLLKVGGGALGMCRLPGYEVTALARDIAALEATGAALVVTLLQAEELYLLLGMMEPDIGFFPRMGRASFRHRHFPIRNGGVPAAMAEFAGLVEELCEEIAAGRTVVLHCVAGHGRTGLAAACCLVRFGWRADAAVQEVRRVRQGTVETGAQADFVGAYAAWRAATISER